jgi:chemotaxis protein CheD
LPLQVPNDFLQGSMNSQSPKRPAAAALPGFEHIERVWDAHHNIWLAKVYPGDVGVTTSAEGVTAVLGSCLSACLRDTRTGLGGMNHFMVLEDRHSNDAMNALVDAVLAHGCGERSRLELKLVGGSCLKPGAQDVGRRTLDFVRKFATTATLAIAAEDVGGVLGREVIYWPGTGQLRIRKLRGIQALLAKSEREYSASLQAPAVGDTGGRVG